MLTQLTLQNVALVAEAEVGLNSGFNVITGETGAGKSLLLDALQLCLGGRTDGGLIRYGQTHATVFAEFDISRLPQVQAWLIEQNYPADDNVLLIRRQLSQPSGANGAVRSKAWLNGMPISLNELKTVGQLLVHIHTQHAQHSLLRPQFVLEWLDRATGLERDADAVRHAFHAYERLVNQAQRHAQDERLRQQQIELLTNQLADIEPISTVDYAKLEAEHDELSNLEQLMQQAAVTVGLLNNEGDEPDALRLLSRAIKLCEAQATLSPTYQTCLEQLYQAQVLVSEAAASLTDYAEGQSLDPERLAQLDDQLATFHRLARKYHTSPDELIATSQAWQVKLDELQAVASPEAIAAQIDAAYQQYLTLATSLDEKRRQRSEPLAAALVERLQELALPNVQAQFNFNPFDKPQSTGLSQVELLFSANIGMPMQPLHKIASGGELSRLALVMQVLDAQGHCRPQLTDMTDTTDRPSDQATSVNPANQPQLLVFDEVDIGISGATAQVVGKLLRTLGQQQQVIAITHQAQVASQAHQHILVYKTQQDQAKSHLRVLAGEEQVHELARMSGGIDITDTTLEHARSLLAQPPSR